MNRLYQMNPELFDKYILTIGCSNLLLLTDKRCKSGVYMRGNSKLHGQYIEFNRRCPLSDADIDEILQEAYAWLVNLDETKQREASKTQDYRKAGLKRLTARAYTLAVIRDKYGLHHTEFASPKYGAAFMLYHFPFTDSENDTIDVDAAEEFAEDWLNTLKSLSDSYGFKFYDVDTPLGGNIIRGRWSFCVFGPDVIVKKNSLDVVEVVKFGM